jgi:hypothetical protein
MSQYSESKWSQLYSAYWSRPIRCFLLAGYLIGLPFGAEGGGISPFRKVANPVTVNPDRNMKNEEFCSQLSKVKFSLCFTN